MDVRERESFGSIQHVFRSDPWLLSDRFPSVRPCIRRPKVGGVSVQRPFPTDPGETRKLRLLYTDPFGFN